MLVSDKGVLVSVNLTTEQLKTQNIQTEFFKVDWLNESIDCQDGPSLKQSKHSN